MTTPNIGHVSSPLRIAPALTAIKASLRAFADSLAAAVDATSAYDRLSSLSDAELARRGLRREDVARQAFAATLARRPQR